ENRNSRRLRRVPEYSGLHIRECPGQATSVGTGGPAPASRFPCHARYAAPFRCVRPYPPRGAYFPVSLRLVLPQQSAGVYLRASTTLRRASRLAPTSLAKSRRASGSAQGTLAG